jgi:hypothetical protein
VNEDLKEIEMGLYPKALNEYLTLIGIPRGPLSRVFIVDPQHGSDSNPGNTFQAPLLTVAAALAKCVTNHNDCVVMVGGPTADNPAAAIDWNLSYTHLIGLSADLPGMGQRCRIVNTAANDLAVLFTVSGSGCIFRNIQWFDGKDKAEVGACVLVTGGRNFFKNCFFGGMGDATGSGPATRAGSYSLSVSGGENYFEDCTIGLDTIVRSAANAELVVSGVRNRFKHCDIRSNSVTAGKFLVKIDASADMRDVIFDDCLFFNYSTNWATGITDAFNVSGGNTHYVILRGLCEFVGVGIGVADTVTHVYGAGPLPVNTYGVAINPST